MKLVCPYFDDVIKIDEPFVHSLIIENQNVFRELIEDFTVLCGNSDGKSILSISDNPVSFSHYCEIISSFVPFDINKKSLLTSIISSLEKTALNEEFFSRTQQILSKLEVLIDEISFDYTCSVHCTKITINSLLKAVGIELADDYDSIPEKIIDYMELVREFDKDKLFITVNMRSYFTDDTMQFFCDTVISHKFRLLMIENFSYPILEKEKRITIDKDICIF